MNMNGLDLEVKKKKSVFDFVFKGMKQISFGFFKEKNEQLSGHGHYPEHQVRNLRKNSKSERLIFKSGDFDINSSYSNNSPSTSSDDKHNISTEIQVYITIHNIKKNK
jgi:hypothetical protein